jgi:replicative DNA helicase
MTEPLLERTQPQDLDAEQSALGGMLLSKNAIGDVVDILQSGADFYRPAHEAIYAAILDMYGRGEPVDPITVGNELTKRGSIVKVGGAPYLHTLVNAVPTAANAAHYAQIITDLAKLRRLIEAGTRMVQMGFAAEGDIAEILDAAGSEFNAVVQDRQDDEGALIGDDDADMVDELEALQRDGHAMGVPTGFTDIDSLTHGLHPGQMLIVAGRPAMGKSTLGVDFIRACSIKHQRPAAFFSLEMSRREVQHRIYSAEAKIALHHIRGGNMDDADWNRLAVARERVTVAPLTIDATPGRTLMQIKAKCRRLQQRSGLDLVVIDYLQLLQSGVRRPENRQVEVSEMSRNIKLMAKELGVPVVVLAQLNRGPEQRQDKKPMLSDLRESGSLEQDADVVILLHREDMYEKESPRAGEADLIVAKHRNGPTATITVAAQLHYSRFVDMAQS